MKLVGLTLFGVGYVLGSKAGRERYEQIRSLTRAVTERLEDPSTQSRLSEYTDRLAAYARPTDNSRSGKVENGTASHANTTSV
jgi:hypothetical protein